MFKWLTNRFKKTELNRAEYPTFKLEIRGTEYFVHFYWPKQTSKEQKHTTTQNFAACMYMLQTSQMRGMIKAALDIAGENTNEKDVSDEIYKLSYNASLGFFVNMIDKAIDNYEKNSSSIMAASDVFKVNEKGG